MERGDSFGFCNILTIIHFLERRCAVLKYNRVARELQQKIFQLLQPGNV